MAETITCRTCSGTGAEMVECDDDHPVGETCWACVATGGMIQSECYYCDGSGQLAKCDN